MGLLIAIWQIWRGRAERICAPGRWVVSRDEARIRVELKL